MAWGEVDGEYDGCDARGRRVTVLDPLALQWLHRHDVIPRADLSAIVKDVGPGMRRWQFRGYLASVVVFFGCLIFLIVRKFVIGMGWSFDTLERFLWPFNLAVFLFSVVMAWRGARRVRSKRVRTVMLRYRRCPHCGYDLRGSPSDPDDGATVCPECGCAWQLDEAVGRSRAS
jgi:hypothetical protein